MAGPMMPGAGGRPAERLTVSDRPDGMIALRIDWTLDGDQHDPPQHHELVLRPTEAVILGETLANAGHDSPGAAVGTQSPVAELYRVVLYRPDAEP